MQNSPQSIGESTNVHAAKSDKQGTSSNKWTASNHNALLPEMNCTTSIAQPAPVYEVLHPLQSVSEVLRLCPPSTQFTSKLAISFNSSAIKSSQLVAYFKQFSCTIPNDKVCAVSTLLICTFCVYAMCSVFAHYSLKTTRGVRIFSELYEQHILSKLGRRTAPCQCLTTRSRCHICSCIILEQHNFCFLCSNVNWLRAVQMNRTGQ